MITHKQNSFFAALFLGCVALSNASVSAMEASLPYVATSSVIVPVETNKYVSFLDRIELPTRKNVVIGAILLAVAKIVLDTKNNKQNLTLRNLKSDARAIVNATLNGHLRLALNLLKDFVNDYAIGRAFKTVDVTYDSIKEDGTVIKVKDKYVKSLPFGLMGLFDAYVLKQMKSITENNTPLILAVVGLSNYLYHNQLPGLTLSNK